MPAFTFPAEAGTHLPTLEGWKAELALGCWLVTYPRAKPCVVAVLRGSVWAALLLSCETGCSLYLYRYTCIICL